MKARKVIGSSKKTLEDYRCTAEAALIHLSIHLFVDRDICFAISHVHQ